VSSAGSVPVTLGDHGTFTANVSTEPQYFIVTVG
jgi:hypothetical protein